MMQEYFLRNLDNVEGVNRIDKEFFFSNEFFFFKFLKSLMFFFVDRRFLLILFQLSYLY